MHIHYIIKWFCNLTTLNINGDKQKLHVSQWRPPLKPNYFVLKTSDSGATLKVTQSSIFTYSIWLGNDQEIIKRK